MFLTLKMHFRQRTGLVGDSERPTPYGDIFDMTPDNWGLET